MKVNGMLQENIDWVLYDLWGLDSSLRSVQTLNFFVYDSLKIILLLFVMIFIVGVLRTYMPLYKIKKWLSGKRLGVGNLIASLFGAVTPFCSCSSIPIFLSFIKARIPLGVTFSFLITSPLVNEYLVVVMLGMFGWKITLAYVVFGVLIGFVSGLVLGEMRLENHLVKDIFKEDTHLKKEVYKDIKARIDYGMVEAASIVRKLWLWVIVGVGAGAFIHNYIPEEIIHAIIAKGGIFTVPVAVILGVPMYGSCAAIVPIALVLFQKGIPLGTALAFMMAISALSLPEAIILKRAMKAKLIGLFFLIVTVAIIVVGYLINFLQIFLV